MIDRAKAIKEEVPMDFWIVAMLYYGASVADTARKLGVSRTQVYNATNRLEELLLKYGLLDISKPVE